MLAPSSWNFLNFCSAIEGIANTFLLNRKPHSERISLEDLCVIRWLNCACPSSSRAIDLSQVQEEKRLDTRVGKIYTFFAGHVAI